jgi:ABC-type lipoprotein export system ATPase subunit
MEIMKDIISVRGLMALPVGQENYVDALRSVGRDQAGEMVAIMGPSGCGNRLLT